MGARVGEPEARQACRMGSPLPAARLGHWVSGPFVGPSQSHPGAELMQGGRLPIFLPAPGGPGPLCPPPGPAGAQCQPLSLGQPHSGQTVPGGDHDGPACPLPARPVPSCGPHLGPALTAPALATCVPASETPARLGLAWEAPPEHTARGLPPSRHCP
ncbi:unnamed protein product [Rangifer tarandus platyrhynchus]|uniref:Uncharacterized protein n=1 Tax=Rangifer tarandus platyrhynchus TaxID=3082113 RepID=A0AC59ZSL9_RANTA